MYLPLHQASFHSLRISVTDGVLRGLEAASNSLEHGWRVVSTTPLLQTDTQNTNAQVFHLRASTWEET